jgi:hypothetical protein
MTEPALKAEIWVKAQIRVCDIHAIPCFVVRKGDPDAGSILLKLNRLNAGVVVFSQVRTDGGIRAWMRATGDEPVSETDADAYIERQLNFDPDIWVLEIEDPDGTYVMDGEIV